MNARRAPADVRPERPALWFADALLTGVMTRDSIPVRGLKLFCLLKPGSITYLCGVETTQESIAYPCMEQSPHRTSVVTNKNAFTSKELGAAGP